MALFHEHFTWDGLPVLGVEGLIDLVKQVERGRVTLLNGEYQGQSHQRLLASRQLLHLSHLALLPCERHLHTTREVVCQNQKAQRPSIWTCGLLYHYYRRIENAEGYVLIVVYLFICIRVPRITQKVLNRIAWNLVGWLVIIRGPFD